MTIEEIKELLQLFNESGVDEMELQRGDNRLRLRRASASQEHVVTAASNPGPPPSALMTMPSMAIPPSLGSTPHLTGASTAESSNVLVKSPIVGTYYDAPAPGAQQFVRVGDTVESGQILCIIESMKLMNEIEAEVAGVIAAKLVENGQPVEYGEALFAIRPK